MYFNNHELLKCLKETNKQSKSAKTTLGSVLSMNIIANSPLSRPLPMSLYFLTLQCYETYLTQYKITIIPRHITAKITPPINDPTAIPAVADDCPDSSLRGN